MVCSNTYCVVCSIHYCVVCSLLCCVCQCITVCLCCNTLLFITHMNSLSKSDTGTIFVSVGWYMYVVDIQYTTAFRLWLFIDIWYECMYELTIYAVGCAGTT